MAAEKAILCVLFEEFSEPDEIDINTCSCGSVVEHCVSSAKVVGSIPREHILTKNV